MSSRSAGVVLATLLLAVSCHESAAPHPAERVSTSRPATAAKTSSSAPRVAEPYRVSNDVHAPIVTRRVEPDFTKCNGAHSGSPSAEGVVRSDGSFETIRITRSVDACIDAAFVAALGQWKFSPGTLRGKPIDVIYDVTVYIHYR